LEAQGRPQLMSVTLQGWLLYWKAQVVSCREFWLSWVEKGSSCSSKAHKLQDRSEIQSFSILFH